VLGKGKAFPVMVMPGRALSKQSLWGQVSVKFTPEMCPMAYHYKNNKYRN
jgi:hypothetical protein